MTKLSSNDLFSRLTHRFMEFPGPDYTISEEELKAILAKLAEPEMVRVPRGDIQAIIDRLAELIS